MASDPAAPYINENYNVHTNTIRIGSCNCAPPSVVLATFAPDTGKISIYSPCARKKGHTYTQTQITAELAGLDPPRKKPRKSALEGRLQTEYHARQLLRGASTMQTERIELLTVTGSETDAQETYMVQDDYHVGMAIDGDQRQEEPLNESTGALVHVPAASRALTRHRQIDSTSPPEEPCVRNALELATHPVYVVQNREDNTHLRLFNGVHVSKELLRVMAVDALAIWSAVAEGDMKTIQLAMLNAVTNYVPLQYRHIFTPNTLLFVSHYLVKAFFPDIQHPPSMPSVTWQPPQVNSIRNREAFELLLRQLQEQPQVLGCANTGRVLGELEEPDADGASSRAVVRRAGGGRQM